MPLRVECWVFSNFVRNLNLSKKCNPGSVFHRHEMCLPPSLFHFFTIISASQKMQIRWECSDVLIMPQVYYFSPFFLGLQMGVFIRIEPRALTCQMFRMYVKTLHFVHRAVIGRSPGHRVQLLHLTCLVLSASSEGVRTTAAPW